MTQNVARNRSWKKAVFRQKREKATLPGPEALPAPNRPSLALPFRRNPTFPKA
jgi:hypothetical protein